MLVRNPLIRGAEVIVSFMFHQAVTPLTGKVQTFPLEIPRKVEGGPKAMENSRADIHQATRVMAEEEFHLRTRREAMEGVHQTLCMEAEAEVDRSPQIVEEAENPQTHRMEAVGAEAHQTLQEAEMATCQRNRNNLKIHRSPHTTRKSALC